MAARKRRQPRRRHILVVNIIVHDDTITVSPTIVRANPGDVVQWQAPGAESFVLVFRDGALGSGNVEVRSGGRRPLLAPDAWARQMLIAAGSNQGPIARVPVVNGTPGVHQYQLAILKSWVDEGKQRHEKVYLDAGCPEVIIE